MAALPKAKEIVSTNPVVFYSKTYCPFCVEVKQLLTKLGATYKAIELDTETDGSDIQSALAEWAGQRTVPNVFIGGKHIGGCDSTTALHSEGKLVHLLVEAGAVAKKLLEEISIPVHKSTSIINIVSGVWARFSNAP